MPDIPLARRVPGPWHCTHNVRVMMWIMLKDIACQCGVLLTLQAAMASIGLGNIAVTADKKPRKAANIEHMVNTENEAAAAEVGKQEADSRTTKASMTGVELQKVFKNFAKIFKAMLGATNGEDSVAEKLMLQRWGAPFTLALAAFNEGCKVLLADLWPINRSTELKHLDLLRRDHQHT